MKVSHCIPQLVGVADCPVTPIIYTAGRPAEAIKWQCEEVWKLSPDYAGIIINDDERKDLNLRLDSYLDLMRRFPESQVYEYGVQGSKGFMNYCIATNMDEPVSPKSATVNSLRKFVNGLPRGCNKIVLLQDRTKPSQGYRLSTEAYLIELADFCKKNKLDIVVWTEAFTGGSREPQLIMDAKLSGKYQLDYVADMLCWIIDTLKKATA